MAPTMGIDLGVYRCACVYSVSASTVKRSRHRRIPSFRAGGSEGQSFILSRTDPHGRDIGPTFLVFLNVLFLEKRRGTLQCQEKDVDL